MPDGAILLADQTPESLAAAMMALLDDESRRQEMSQNAVTYMKDRTLEYSDRQFLEAVQHMLADDYRSFELVQPMYTKSPFQSAIELGHLSAVRGIQARGALRRPEGSPQWRGPRCRSRSWLMTRPGRGWCLPSLLASSSLRCTP